MARSKAGPVDVPLPPVVDDEDEDLSNLLLAWYYTGFYTAKYQMRRSKTYSSGSGEP